MRGYIATSHRRCGSRRRSTSRCTRRNAVEQESRAKMAPHMRLGNLEKEASGFWMAWTLGPAAAQVMPREPPLELEALGHH